MVAPAHLLAFDLDIAIEAARRWRSQEKERAEKLKAISHGDLAAAEPPERVAKRVRHLATKLRQARPLAPLSVTRPLEDLLEEAESRGDAIDGTLVERVIGDTRDFLSIAFLETGLEASRSVGRVVTRMAGGRSGFGTGFLVSQSLLLTNHHVLPSAADAERSFIEFDYQNDRHGNPKLSQIFDLKPGRFFLNDETLDFALVAVESVSRKNVSLKEFGFCPLIAQEGKILIGEPINIIQHPKGEMKQIVVRENRLLDLPQKQGLDRYAHYTADTEPGSSGAPVFNDQWEVVALHHAGVPRMDSRGNLLDVDGRPWRQGDDPGRLAWVGNEGIRVSRLMAFIEGARLGSEQDKLRRELMRIDIPTAPAMTRPHDESADLGPRKRPADAPDIAPPPPESITLTIPLRVTIEIGSASRDTQASSIDLRGEAKKSKGRIPKPDTDYETRAGFDPDFLGASVPLPTLTNTIKNELLTTDDVPDGELKYHHFSVLMNRSRRLAFVSAVNLDGDAPYKEKRGEDRWYYDRRLDEADQTGGDLYVGNDLDRGHLTRRDDAAWGYTDEEARLGNDDTFHWPNCAPQHSIFNQSSQADRAGLILWGNLENHVTDQLSAGLRKLSVFNGPVFHRDDKAYRGVKVPREYWKVIAYRSGRSTKAVAFKLSQADLLRRMPWERDFDPGAFEVFQIKIRELEALTKLDFGDLYKGDPLEADGNERFFEGASEQVPIRSLDDVVL